MGINPNRGIHLGFKTTSKVGMKKRNPTTRSSKLDHRRHQRKGPQLPREGTMMGVSTVEFQGILLEIFEHPRPTAAQHQFVSTVEIEVT